MKLRGNYQWIESLDGARGAVWIDGNGEVRSNLSAATVRSEAGDSATGEVIRTDESGGRLPPLWAGWTLVDLITVGQLSRLAADALELYLPELLRATVHAGGMAPPTAEELAAVVGLADAGAAADEKRKAETRAEQLASDKKQLEVALEQERTARSRAETAAARAELAKNAAEQERDAAKATRARAAKEPK